MTQLSQVNCFQGNSDRQTTDQQKSGQKMDRQTDKLTDEWEDG